MKSLRLDRITWCVCALAAVFALVAAFALGWFFGVNETNEKARNAMLKAIDTLPEPDFCALCGNKETLRHHAPCLVKLSTGDVGELAIYTPHKHLVGEIAPFEEQKTGTFNFFSCADLQGVRDTSNHSCQINIPDEEMPLLMAGIYCTDCRTALSDVGMGGYALVDLYDLSEIKAYPIQAERTYTIRDYVISISKDSRIGALKINVQGQLFRE